MKTGYPFLAISRKYNLEYADVLAVADRMKNLAPHEEFFVDGPMADALGDINKATTHFAAQQSGLIEMQDYVDIS